MSANIVAKEPCLLCVQEGFDSAGDNCVTFDSGVQHCHRHGVIGVPNNKKKGEESFMVDNNKESKFLEGVATSLTKRKISKETCEFYNYLVNAEKKAHIAQWFDDSNQLVMQQIRYHPKDFKFKGDTKRFGKELWGMHKFTPNENLFITITEGQIDTLSIAEAFQCKYPVVSLPNGASAAYEVIKHNLHKLLQYKYVVLAFDNDFDGNKAIEECLDLFPPGKLRIVKWRMKDASDLCQRELYDEIRQAVRNAVAYIPAPVLTGDVLLSRLNSFVAETIDWPWPTLRDNLNPIQRPSVITIAGRPGVGKTITMCDIIKHNIANGYKVGFISLEQTIPHMILKLTSMISGVPVHKINNRQLNEDEIKLCKWVTDSLVTFDHESYGSDMNAILQAMPHIAQSLNCQIIIFDNLSYSATNASDDERRHIDKAMIALKDCSTKHNFTLFNIAHLNDNEDDPNSESMRGSRGIFMYSDTVIYLSRNVESDDILERNTLGFYVKKDRATGEDVGKFLKMYYNSERQCLEDIL